MRLRNLFDALRGSQRRETRDSYTDLIISRLVAQVGGAGAVRVLAAPATEIAAGAWSRAFASAEVDGGPLARMIVTPSLLGDMARDLCERGEFVGLFRSRPTSLTRASSFDVDGPVDAWRYRVDLPAPGGIEVYRAPRDAVVHVRYATDPSTPWRGQSPLESSAALGRLAAGLETRLSEEASAKSAVVVPLPDAGDDEQVEALKADLSGARGGSVLVPTTQSGWGDGRVAAPQADWQPRRIGAMPPRELAELRRDSAQLALAAYGIAPVMLAATPAGQALQVAMRIFVHGTLQPVGELMAEELGRVLDEEIAFDFSAVVATDAASRTRAVKYLVDAQAAANEAGIDIAPILEAVGL